MISAMSKPNAFEDFHPSNIQDPCVTSVKSRLLLLGDINQRLFCIIQLSPDYAIFNTLG